MDFSTRYKALNDAQKQAVDHVDGPLMVVAGPGTGKTELLSMRVAKILQSTDTLPQNILCLTFTESGADAMRDRLTDIIGQDAYKVPIHTFHGFGADVINRYNDYFYSGADFRTAHELDAYEIVRGILDELNYTNPLTTRLNGDYVHIKQILSTISELKRSGLTTSELLQIFDANDALFDAVEPTLTDAFSSRISMTTLPLLLPVTETITQLPTMELPADIAPLPNMLALSLARAVDEALAGKSTKPVTAWKRQWLEKDESNRDVFKARKRQSKLRALLVVYDLYLARMQEAKLFDFDDMILQVVHAMETQPELKFNLQEQYQYIMVDEFQDTNLAQDRILRNLTNNEVSGGRPNIMVVGDDDQAIYSFQGADVGNIIAFRERYQDVRLITLKDNYRSVEPILQAARGVITQGKNRLESIIKGIDKTLTAHVKVSSSTLIELREYDTPPDERAALVADIKAQLIKKTDKRSIAVLARRHSELLQLLPYFADADITVSYEKRDNVLDNELIQLVIQITELVMALAENQHDEAEQLLTEILPHPAWGFNAETIWRLSLSAHKTHQTWLEIMASLPAFQPLRSWLLELAQSVATMPLERLLDDVVGTNETINGSPLYNYFFNEQTLKDDPARYVNYLEALRAIREKVRDYQPGITPTIKTFVECIDLHLQLDIPITVQREGSHQTDAVQLMTVHKSKGREFDNVYITGAIDSAWGEKVRSPSRLISYPENLPLIPPGAELDERLRLFFVAMTRAKQRLIISYARQSESGQELRKASFLLPLTVRATSAPAHDTLTDQLQAARHAWYEPLVRPITSSMHEVLQPSLEHYKLSATHLNTFLDVSRGGPQAFLLNHLLRFPSAMPAAAAYGSAIHATLQRTHSHLKATGQQRPLEDILHDFEVNLRDKYLTPGEYDEFYERGEITLGAFLAAHYDDFSADQKVELGFGGQQVIVGDAQLTGALDLVDVNDTDKTIIVTDYKTGKPSRSWQGKTDFEKIKLHKYKQQLMFYKLLIENSRDYHAYTTTRGVLQFVEPTQSGEILALDSEFTTEEMSQFTKLIEAVWRHIIALDLPNAGAYEPSYKGMMAFEDDLLAEGN